MPALMRSCVVVVALAVMGCGDSGSGALRGEHCNDVGAEVCGRLSQCDLTDSFSECYDGFMDICCEDEWTCNDPSPATQAEIDDCADDLDIIDCGLLEDGAPDTCAGVLADE